MQGYGQFCPVAKATEILGERWTPLIIRELLVDPQSFNTLRKGVPLMSPSLLSSRLKTLEAAGIISRDKTGRGVIYTLTDAGEELRPIVEQLGVWGQRWARSDMSKKDLDPSLLMWDMHRNIDTAYFGDDRKVLRFEYVDYPVKMRLWWLIVTGTNVDICLKDPGHDVDLFIQTRRRHNCLNLLLAGQQDHGGVDRLQPAGRDQAGPPLGPRLQRAGKSLQCAGCVSSCHCWSSCLLRHVSARPRPNPELLYSRS